MMKVNTLFFHMQGIVVIGTIVDLHYVDIIISKNIRVIGRIVKNAGILLRPKCMFIMGRMNIILKFWKIVYRLTKIPQFYQRFSA